jgi:hypothetical protein
VDIRKGYNELGLGVKRIRVYECDDARVGPVVERG